MNFKKHAFTLAEILIVITVIGVVAALTIPALIAKNQERVTVNKVKKFYSMINKAFLLAREEYGDVDGWNIKKVEGNVSTKESVEDFAAYIKQYLKIAVDCGTTCDKYMSDSISYLNGTVFAKPNHYKADFYYKILLMDGSFMWFRVNGNNCTRTDGDVNNVCALIWYDVNGKYPPNTLGKDNFVFYVLNNSIISHQYDDCYLDSHGWGCAKYILTNNNMHYPKTNNK